MITKSRRELINESTHKYRKGFTLVEIMIVIAIISLLAVIAMPNYFRARKRAQAARIIDDLRALSSALDQYTIEFGRVPGQVLSLDQIRPYVKTHTVLYESGKDALGHNFQATYVVDDPINTPVGTWDAMSDVTDVEYWSPFAVQ